LVRPVSAPGGVVKDLIGAGISETINGTRARAIWEASRTGMVPEHSGKKLDDIIA
jgi:hypothetical protein